MARRPTRPPSPILPTARLDRCGAPLPHPSPWPTSAACWWSPKASSRGPKAQRSAKSSATGRMVFCSPVRNGPTARGRCWRPARAGSDQPEPYPLIVRFSKGHGTGNDFVILPDPDGRLELTPELVAAVCDRRRGVGGDGVLRVVRTAAAGLARESDAEWFMDYRNADGSIAEMCGNGVRVYARYLIREGWARPGVLALATRAGDRIVTVP